MCVLYQHRITFSLRHTRLDRFLKVEWMNRRRNGKGGKLFPAEGKVKLSDIVIRFETLLDFGSNKRFSISTLRNEFTGEIDIPLAMVSPYKAIKWREASKKWIALQLPTEFQSLQCNTCVFKAVISFFLCLLHSSLSLSRYSIHSRTKRTRVVSMNETAIAVNGRMEDAEYNGNRCWTRRRAMNQRMRWSIDRDNRQRRKMSRRFCQWVNLRSRCF